MTGNKKQLYPLVIGSQGQLGQALMKLVPEAFEINRAQIDLSKSDVYDRLVAFKETYTNISGVINAAAYTAVDKAEDDKEIADKVNGRATGQIADFCQKFKLPFVHISTDYVFSGDSKTPYRPEHPTDPINAYGYSKRLGEAAIDQTSTIVAILRTSWVYDSFNKNFLTTMLRLSETRDALTVVDDQIGRPTYTYDLAYAALIALEGIRRNPSKAGIYHVSNTGAPIITGIPSENYPTPAKRPAYSVMDTSKFETSFGVSLPSWKDGLSRSIFAKNSRST